MDDGRRNPGAPQAAHQPIGTVLGAGKDQHAIQAWVLEQAQQQFELLVLSHGVQHLSDRIWRDRLFHLHAHGLARHLARQGDDRLKRGREEHRLALLRQHAHDATNVWQEADVQHAVGLVQHQHLQRCEGHVTPLDLVQQTAGRGDDDVNALSQGVILRTIAHAAIDGGNADGHAATQQGGVLGDLQGELARGHQDERARMARTGRCHQLLQQREQVRRCLAGARLGGSEDVEAVKGLGDGRGLNGGGSLEAHVLQIALQAGIEVETIELHKTPVLRPGFPR